MENLTLKNAIDKLSAAFAVRDWKYLDVPSGSPREKTFAWPGKDNEEIIVCVHKDANIREMFHRQDFFFFNYAYKGDYGAISYKYDNHITVREKECYIGQPYAGYALYSESEQDIIIVGVLVRKDTFFKTFLPMLSADENLFRFFLEPQTNEYSEEFIHLRFDDDFGLRSLLEIMIIEYADTRAETQAILRSLTVALFMLVARQYKKSAPKHKDTSLSGKVVRYINEHTGAISLKDIAAEFSYHPNYLSAVLHKEMGKTFSEILNEQRMNRAATLITKTDLPIEEIAYMLGYADPSNFYKAFKAFYNCSPREYFETQ